MRLMAHILVPKKRSSFYFLAESLPPLSRSTVDIMSTVVIVVVEYAGFKKNRLRPARFIHASGSFWWFADPDPGTRTPQRRSQTIPRTNHAGPEIPGLGGQQPWDPRRLFPRQKPCQNHHGRGCPPL